METNPFEPVIAILDFLRFGIDKNSDKLLQNAIKGISYYGNCVGVPNIGGDLFRGEIYNKNPLVNVGAIGIMKKENIIYGNALDENNLLIYVGSKTGEEGIGGAAMASKSFSSKIDDLVDNVQKSDPFLEKLLLEACIELSESKLAIGMQDMGAGGLLCASYEVVHRGREKTKLNMGCNIYIDKIPTKCDMNPCDILISESQERMLIVASKSNIKSIFSIFEKWDLEYSVIGETTKTGNYEVWLNNNLLYSKPLSTSILTEVVLLGVTTSSSSILPVKLLLSATVTFIFVGHELKLAKSKEKLKFILYFLSDDLSSAVGFIESINDWAGGERVGLTHGVNISAGVEPFVEF